MKTIYNNILLKFLENEENNTAPTHTQNFNHNHNIETSNENKKYAVIVEPRYDKITKAVIKNFAYFLKEKNSWQFIIYSYSAFENRIINDFPNAIFYAIDNLYKDSIYFNTADEPNISIETYNKILMDKEFWNRIPNETVAIFQRDCIMFREPLDIYYMYYDFAGANYYNEQDIAPFYGGINGGFSFRKKSAMLDCLNKITWEIIETYNNAPSPIPNQIPTKTTKIGKYAEDVFFTFACEILKKNVPDKINRTHLAIETDQNPNTSVLHGWHHEYHSNETATAYLRNSPLFSKYIDAVLNDLSTPTKSASKIVPETKLYFSVQD